MKQYRPDIERQKWLYSMEKSRMWMRRRKGRAEENQAILVGRQQIPDNSEAWIPGGVRTVADAIWISDQIGKAIKEWKLEPQRN